MSTPSVPWLKGLPAAIADPIDPVNGHDVRPSVKDLIVKHRESIEKAKAILEKHALFVPQKHDDLWILRFCLSRKKTKDAVNAAEHALEFRDEHKLDETDIRFFGTRRGESNLPQSYSRYVEHCNAEALQWTLPDPKRGVICFIDIGSVDGHELVKNLDEKDWLGSFIHLNEWTFQWQDYITRVTGRLTKSVRLLDFKQAKMSGMNQEASKRDAAVMGVMEDVYPQLLRTIYICHAPGWIQIPWRILRPFFPKRVIEKMDFINPDKRQNERDRLLEHLDEANLPVRFGGKYEAWPTAFPLPVL